jgi:Fe-S cluster biogenesis protein NfuA
MSEAAETTSTTDSLRARVAEAINLIRPAIQQDGGDVELLEVTLDGIVKIRFHGACCGCPSANMTLYGGIRRVVIDRVPEIKQIIAIR